MHRSEPPADDDRPQPLTDEEIQQIRDALNRQRAISGMYRAVRSFAIWFIGFSALAITFKQSVLDFVQFIRGLLK